MMHQPQAKNKRHRVLLHAAVKLPDHAFSLPIYTRKLSLITHVAAYPHPICATNCLLVIHH